ncbi:MAG: 23S rRNA (uracil(1939)-C(5))-methyltransferase RlmD [Coriobacteriia bacterium]|nr:23S rRNA (uracil(1939)-C(5))-methyltransferase RlmD [Coriobacteriia bacterium]
MRLEIERLAHGGDGIAHAPDGRTVFVRGACPGDVVDVDLVGEHDRYLNATIREIIAPSADRIDAPCPYFGVCGGCQWQHVSYEQQLQAKTGAVVDALSRIGGIADPPVEACASSPETYGYRNKIELNAADSNRGLEVGMMRADGQGIVSIDSCLLLPPKSNKLPKAVRGALRYLAGGRELSLLRAGIRVAAHGRDTEIALWTRPGPFPRKLAATTLAQATGASGIMRVMVKDDPAKRAIAGVEVLKGRGAWKERIAGQSMLVSAPSFFQVNTHAAETLISLAITAAQVDGSDRVLDLYAGVGTFTLPLAEVAGEVIAVESYGPAVSDLRRNIERAESPAFVEPGDAVRVLADIGPFDVVLVDPPRTGLASDAVPALINTGARRIVYVSCDPATLARDAKLLTESGYSLTKAYPVDLFPQTYHVETVAVFCR